MRVWSGPRAQDDIQLVREACVALQKLSPPPAKKGEKCDVCAVQWP